MTQLGSKVNGKMITDYNPHIHQPWAVGFIKKGKKVYHPYLRLDCVFGPTE